MITCKREWGEKVKELRKELKEIKRKECKELAGTPCAFCHEEITFDDYFSGKWDFDNTTDWARIHKRCVYLGI